MPEEMDGRFVAVVDAMLGFGATGPLRPPFDHMIGKLAASQSRTPVISVDIPSGWDVEEGDVHGESSDLTEKPGADAWIDSSARLCGVCLVATGFHPAALVSLTAPKRCARLYKVGGADLQAGRQGFLTWPCCCLLCWCWYAAGPSLPGGPLRAAADLPEVQAAAAALPRLHAGCRDQGRSLDWSEYSRPFTARDPVRAV